MTIFHHIKMDDNSNSSYYKHGKDTPQKGMIGEKGQIS